MLLITVGLLGLSSVFADSGTTMSSGSYNSINLSIDMLQTDLSTGKLISSVPIPVPAGRAGMAPKIELWYRNNTDNHSNTWCGVGWVLDMGYIQRSTKNGSPTYTDDDTFILSVNNATSELVCVGGSEFRLKCGGNSLKVIKNGSYWEAFDSGGRSYVFGMTPEGRTSYNNTDIYAWHLEKIMDIHGNYISFKYTKDESHPYLDEIRYTGRDSDLGYYRVKFMLEDTPREDIIYYPRKLFEETIRYRLKEILVYANGERIKRYSLQYKQFSNFTRRSLLESITQYGKDDAISLPPVSFGYQKYTNPFPGQEYQAYLSGIDDTNSLKTLGDFNGDGLLDIATYNKNTYQIKVCPRQKDGSFGSHTTWLVYDATSGVPSGEKGQNNGFETQLYSGDFNGDGKTDISFYKFEKLDSYRACYKFMVAISNGGSFNSPQAWMNQIVWQVYDPPYPIILPGDFNGDGKTDLGFPYFGGDGVSCRIRFSTGSGFGTESYWIGGWGVWNSVMSGDFNGDGISDLCGFNSQNGNWGFAISDGESGFVQGRFNSLGGFGAYGPPGRGWQQVLLGDFNGDGLTDLARYDEGNRLLDFAINNGKGMFLTSAQQMGFSVQASYTADYSGDGITDIARMEGSYFYYKDSVGESSEQLISIDNGFGGITEISYKPSTTYNNVYLPYSIQTVSELRYKSQPDNQQRFIRYDFEGGLYEPSQREFRGFGHVMVTDDNGNLTESWFKQDEIFQGRPFKQIYKDADGTIKTASVSEWEDSPLYGGTVHSPQLKEQRSYLVESDTFDEQNPVYIKATKTSYEYDDYGNITCLNEYGDIDNPNDDKAVRTEYAYNIANRLLNLPYSVVLEDASGNIVSKSRIYYDNQSLGSSPIKGLPTKKEAWLNLPSEKWFSSTVEYDTYGNITKTTDPRGNSTTTEYDATLHQYPVKITNALGHNQRFSYDYSRGQILTSQDPNGKITRNEYDSLGRLTRIFGPLDADGYASVIYEYDLSAIPSRLTKKAREDYGVSDYITTYTFYDGFGRAIEMKSPAEPDPATGLSRQIISGIVTYDYRGKVKEGYQSYFADSASEAYSPPSYSTPKTTYDYDSLGRPRTVTAQNEAGDYIQASNSYYGWSVASVDTKGNTKDSYYDAFGRLIKVVEHNDAAAYETLYEYDPQGNLIKVTDSAGNITTITYDSLGRKLSMSDPDMGRWSYAYDDNGNLISQADAKGQVVNFTYDVLNRLVQKSTVDSPQSTVTYTYDQGTNGIGRLNRVDYNNGSTEFYYDELGHEIKSIKTIGATPYTIERTYDALDRLKTLKYPDNETLAYTYGSSGAVKKIQGLTKTYVDNIAYNTQSQMVSLAYGNGIATTYTYNDYTKRLVSLRASKGGEAIQDLSYTFDNIGNITNIDDRKYTATQSFQYDDLNRLIRADNPSGYGTLNFAYDSIGNLTQKGTRYFNYGEGTAGPHALTSSSDGQIACTYDANGNMLHKNDVSYTYDSENRLKRVEKSSSLVHDTFNIPLKAGWNFITLPVVPDGYNINDDIPISVELSSLTYGVDYDQVTRYNTATGKFESYCNNPNYNQFDTIKYLKGYQIYCLRDCTLTITGSSPSTAYSLQLSPGYNLIGVDITNNGKAASAAFFNISYSQIKWYNPNTQQLENISGNDTVEMGRAYYVYCTSSSTYSVSGLRNVTTFTYDGDGGRTTKLANGTTTTYIGSLFEKTSGVTTRHIFLGNTRICSATSSGEYSFYHGDHLGSSTDITDANGTLIQHTEYSPYGEESFTPKTFGDTTDYLFTSKLLDRSTDLYYYGARYYDPELARFTQADTIIPEPANPQSFNRYSYCDNNPINYTDPTGHWKLKDWIGRIVGGVMGVAAWASTGFTNPLAGFQVYSFVSGAINSAISGDIGAFAISTAASILTAGFCQGIGEAVAGATVGMGKTFLRGALIGAAEFGAAGFIAGTASEYARTGSFSDALRGGAWGAAGGAAFGAAIQGSYVAGWQNVAHGLPIDALDAIDMAARFDQLNAEAQKAWAIAHGGAVMYEAKLKTDVGKQLFKSYADMLRVNGLVPIDFDRYEYNQRYFRSVLDWTFKKDFLSYEKQYVMQEAYRSVESSSIYANAVSGAFKKAYSPTRFVK